MAKQKVSKTNLSLDSASISTLKSLDETTIRKNLIIPLLKEIKAENVLDIHGSNEHGIDVYFEWFDIFSHRRRFGIQIKKGDIACKNRPDKNPNIITILNQINMAFSKEIILPDSKSGKISAHIDGYYIIISGKMSQNARDYIYRERKKFPFVHIIEGDELIRTIKNRKLLNRKHNNLFF